MTENRLETTEYFQYIDSTIDEAYSLYMPQVRSEITEFYRFLNQHYGLTKKSEPYNILEIGTKFGGTFFLWCSMNQSSGLNISIDMNDGGLHGGIDEKKMDERDEWFNQRFANCKFIRGDSHKPITRSKLVRRGLMNGVNFKPTVGNVIGEGNLEPFIDFLFIDGDHTYEGVKKDWKMYSPFLKINSICAFHDIKDTQRHRDRNVHVSNLWNEITENRNEKDICIYNEQKYQIVEFIDPLIDWGGIGCLIRL